MADVKAVTRIEAILNGEDITPVTREEAILSGADVEPLSREEYFVQKRLGEGGGGLDYVIPEQTITIDGETNSYPLENVDLDNISVGENFILKVSMSGASSIKYVQLTATHVVEEGYEAWTLSDSGSLWGIVKEAPSTTWFLYPPEVIGTGDLTLSAIRGF